MTRWVELTRKSSFSRAIVRCSWVTWCEFSISPRQPEQNKSRSRPSACLVIKPRPEAEAHTHLFAPEGSTMAIPTGDQNGVFASINITPLTDIFLVLLIIFMVATAITIESAAHVDLPQLQAPSQAQQPNGV